MIKNKQLTNNSIKARNVMLIDHDGSKLGIVSIDKALEKANSLSLDLVQVSAPDSNPVVCKILDYGKMIFDKKKNQTNAKVKVKKRTLKEIKFRPNTDLGDFNIKLKKIKSFINDGNKTKISVRFRGREILNSNLGLELLERLQNEVIRYSSSRSRTFLRGQAAVNDSLSIKKEIVMGYKLKTHSGAAKRFKKTGSSVKSKSANRNHILTKQSTKRKRHNRGLNKLEGTVLKIASRLIKK